MRAQLEHGSIILPLAYPRDEDSIVIAFSDVTKRLNTRLKVCVRLIKTVSQRESIELQDRYGLGVGTDCILTYLSDCVRS